MKRIHAIVSGKVQGVYYRASTVKQASALGLRGWVRNMPDGRVEFEAEGEDSEVRALLAWAAGGPTLARVDNINSKDIPTLKNETGFVVRR